VLSSGTMREDKNPGREYKFKIGDFVQLKSGGQKMTVGAIPMSTFGPDYHCQWFSKGGKLNQGNFNEESLTYYVEAPD